MRRENRPRVPRGVFAGAVGLTAVLAAYGSSAAQAPAREAIGATVVDPTLYAGQRAHLDGRLASGTADVPVLLEHRASGARGWTIVARARTVAGGWFGVGAALSRSGDLRVASAGDVAASAPRAVTVRASVRIRTARTDVLAGRAAVVTGLLTPASAGRWVVLDVLRRGHWRAVARTRTGGGGAFRLMLRAPATGSYSARVRFAGDAPNAAVAYRLRRRLRAYASGEASFYGPGFWGGALACGGRLTRGTLGVAHRTLPCGTMVTLRYAGRSVRVPVIDRGPYAGNRAFDLTEATKEKLGFPDVGTVWYTT